MKSIKIACCVVVAVAVICMSNLAFAHEFTEGECNATAQVFAYVASVRDANPKEWPKTKADLLQSAIKASANPDSYIKDDDDLAVVVKLLDAIEANPKMTPEDIGFEIYKACTSSIVKAAEKNPRTLRGMSINLKR